MIIYYDKNTGKIYGAILGRVHNEFELKPDLIQPQGVPKGQIERRIFDLEQTKEVEKYLESENIKILDCVINKHGDDVFLAKKPKEEKPKPDSVETLLIDLEPDIEAIEANFSENTKRNLKAVADQTMTFREIPFSEISKVRDVIEELEDAKDIKLAKHLLTIRSAFLDGIRRAYVVEDENGEVLSAAIITAKAGRFIYTLGGTTLKGRETHASDFMVANLIRDAKALGFKHYDLGGIYTDQADTKKQKVNKFKQRWGGKPSPLI